jgi:hypothetical protein
MQISSGAGGPRVVASAVEGVMIGIYPFPLIERRIHRREVMTRAETENELSTMASASRPGMRDVGIGMLFL